MDDEGVNMKKVSITRFYFVCFIINSMSCVILPVTPTIFKNINFPDYMFGVSFAAMAAGMFLFSPYWGRLGDRVGHTNALILSCVGYCIGQILFGVSRTVWLTILVRFFTGFFSAGTMVSFMSYVADSGEGEKQKAKYMSYYSAVLSVSNAAGYFLGGVIGSASIFYAFVFQIAGVIFSCVYAWICLEDPVNVKVRFSGAKSLNPFEALKDIKEIASVSFIMILTAVFLAAFGTFAFDNTLSYFLRAELDFPASYNGYIKAAVGIIGLLANFTINMFIIEKTNIRISIIYVLFMCGITALILYFVRGNALFVIITLIHFTFNSIYMPIIQVLATKADENIPVGSISGVFNSIRSLGMFLGSMAVGFIYVLDSRIPFIAVAAAFLSGSFVCMANYMYYGKQKSIEQNKLY